MTPDTYTFNGNVTTFLGLIGISSTLLIVVVAFRRFFNSPYNVRMNNVTEATDSDYQDFWENEDSINPTSEHAND